MKLPFFVKHNFRVFIFCLPLLFSFLCAISLSSSEDNGKCLDLYFDLDNGELRLREVVFVLSSAPESTFLKGGYRIEMRSQDKKLLFQTYFRDPGIVYYDLLNTTTSELSGGIVSKAQKLFRVRIPYLLEAEDLYIFDPAGDERFRAVLDQTIAQMLRSPHSPQWEVDTLMYNGDPSNRIDIVFLGDGYTIDDTALYTDDVQAFLNFMFGSFSPYDEYSTYFNVYKVKVISEESGSDHPEWDPPVYRNTALGTYYGCEGIDRLICADDESVYAAAQSVPWYDEIGVLVNDPTYGGSGGDYLVTYNGNWGEYVFVHELGHSFAYLADEYLYGDYPGSVPNCNCDSNSVNPGWQSWIDISSPGVGTFLGCSYNNLYRPTYDACMMMSLQTTFCVVCREQTIRSIYELVRGYDEFSPLTDTLTLETSSPQTFELTPLIPNSHFLEISWFVNDELKSSDNPFDFISSVADSFTVKGTVYDSTPMVLDDPLSLLADSKEWQVTVIPGSYICGDPNQDSTVNIVDVVFIINYIFKGGPEPVPLASGDVNLDQEVNVVDVVYLIGYLFKGGPEPCHL